MKSSKLNPWGRKKGFVPSQKEKDKAVAPVSRFIGEGNPNIQEEEKDILAQNREVTKEGTNGG